MEITFLYASLLIILAVFMAYKVGTTRLKTNTLLGAGDSSEMLQSVRGHGNLIENAPFFIILIGLLEMQGIADWKLHLLGSSFFSLEFFMPTECLSQERALRFVWLAF